MDSNGWKNRTSLDISESSEMISKAVSYHHWN